MKQLRSLDWEAIAGIAAAMIALVLHLLHIAEEDVLLAVILVLLALIMLRDLKREGREEGQSESTARLLEAVGRLQSALTPPETILIGPRQLRSESERFSRQARGEMIWFNVCLLMFEPQDLFDVLLRPALEDDGVTSVQFILDPSEEDRWRSSVLPKASSCSGFAKLREPRFAPLAQDVSFILADTAGGTTEAHVSFWGEPFMARERGQSIPRYIFHVQPHSQLIPQLIELERGHRGRRQAHP